MSVPALSVAFLLDCDDTLLDNDALKADLETRLAALLGDDLNARLWHIYEEVRRDTATVDLPLTLDRFAALCPDATLAARARAIVMDYPFAERLYPDALATLAHLRTLGEPCILSDGDAVYQPLKIERSGLASACGGRVLIFVHKEQHLDAVMAHWPASLYVVVDDKVRILADIKRQNPGHFVTVHVRQGHYGTDPTPSFPPPDLVLDHIGELLTRDVDDFKRLLGA